FGASSSTSTNTALLRRVPRPEPAPSLESYARRRDVGSRRLRGFEEVLGFAPETAVHSADLHDLLLVSADSRLSSERRRGYLDAVDALIERRLRPPDGGPAIVAPDPQRVTMTSRTADIPLELENRLEYPVRVRIEMRSEKLSFPKG